MLANQNSLGVCLGAGAHAWSGQVWLTQDNFIFDCTIDFGLFDDFPVKEQKFLDSVIRIHLQIREHVHKQARIVLIIWDNLD